MSVTDISYISKEFVELRRDDEQWGKKIQAVFSTSVRSAKTDFLQKSVTKMWILAQKGKCEMDEGAFGFTCPVKKSDRKRWES